MNPVEPGNEPIAMERVSGPYRGFFVAAYVIERGGQYFGYAKICASEPKAVLDCTPISRVSSAIGVPSSEGAIHLAEQRARDIIRAMHGEPKSPPSGTRRHNAWMRFRRRLPSTPGAWVGAVITSALLVVAFAMLDGIGCNLYAQRIAAATTGAASPLYKPAQILEGRLCTGHDCTAAVLVQGLLSIDTLAEIRERAVATSPAVLTVCFNSPGGTFESSEAAGALPANVSTCVADLVGKDGAQRLQALCASACAWTWMAGSKKAIYGSNTVGFHAPYQYDAAACVPGNRLKAYLSVAMGWIDDVEKKRFDRATRAVRHRLRLASVGKGPTELYSVDVEQAQALGLQPRQVVPAAFYVAPAGHASTRR